MARPSSGFRLPGTIQPGHARGLVAQHQPLDLPHAQPQPCGLEPRFGHRLDDLEPVHLAHRQPLQLVLIIYLMSNIMRKLVDAMRAIKATLLLAISRPATA
jgi:hypothetical protein